MARTALELTPQEWRAYQPGKFAGAQPTSRTATDDRRRRRAWRIARQAAQLLRQRYHATKVVLFGSLAHDAWFTSWSDIDLAAWGIPPEQFYSAVAAVTELSATFKIDLVDADACRPSLRTVIEREGIEL